MSWIDSAQELSLFSCWAPVLLWLTRAQVKVHVSGCRSVSVVSQCCQSVPRGSGGQSKSVWREESPQTPCASPSHHESMTGPRTSLLHESFETRLCRACVGESFGKSFGKNLGLSPSMDKRTKGIIVAYYTFPEHGSVVRSQWVESQIARGR